MTHHLPIFPPFETSAVGSAIQLDAFCDKSSDVSISLALFFSHSILYLIHCVLQSSFLSLH